MQEEFRHLAFPAIEGTLAMIAALSAVAFRRRTRWFTPAGFIMLALGLIFDLMTPRGVTEPVWAPYTRAVGISLMWCALIRLAMESVENSLRRRKIPVSTIVSELTLTGLYATVVAIVGYHMLDFHIRGLIAIPTLFTLGQAALEHRDMFSGLLIQSQRPFRPGDWVRVGEQVGQVQGTGWGVTRIVTRAGESVMIPSGMLASGGLTNYSASGHVADELFIGLGYGEEPWKIENAIQKVLDDIPEVLGEPRPEVGPWEFGDSSIRYRIRYWVADFGEVESTRGQITRNVWYALRRNATEFPPPAGATPSPASKNHEGLENLMIQDLRKVDLFHELADEDLRIMLPSVKVSQYGRGEVILRQGAIGDSFFVLRRGRVEVLVDGVEGTDRRDPIVVGHIDQRSDRNYFGEIALLKGEHRIATVRAETDLEVLEVSRNGFAHLFKARPESAPAIAKIAASREEETLAQASSSPATAKAVREEQGRILATMRKIFDF
ncbi:MAG: cyclic nucleotide-binding domain-containing protein [Candidatus Binataceae bacterium]